ncbi:glycosyltransferase [Frigoribacterium sp. CG_9.8]|uniref:glycosyltransferase n=1 Tax=Frigoribacterium sp. CG_9.8 TaxID=2787733 RepID=UPI0018CA82E5|nr:undecaprenyl-phosphate 4-deoxy-4-formamido-L-arabinose transferase [Frigoribacterium sp. CG_9.8]
MADNNRKSFGVPHLISVVIPVYGGEKTLTAVLAEVAALTTLTESPDGHPFRVSEALLVYDNGPDDSARIIRALSDSYEFVRPVWLSKNFGQHAATIAGMASSGGDWIVTLDEDGQHDPNDIGTLLDAAMSTQSPVVYAKPVNPAPHGAFRNTASKGAKWFLTKAFAGSNAPDYQSFRLILGSIGRGVAAYSGSGVYLDVALGWVAGRATTAPVRLREEGDRDSGYSTRRLISHFWRMILSSGTRALRLVSVLGVFFAAIGIVVAIFILISRLTGAVVTEGWASTIVIVLLGVGAILFSLGIIAEYIGVSVNMAMGKPPYMITSDPGAGPLGRTRSVSQ